jgi:prepilin-type N-terminal cleavage/methylation domain-containing protein
MRTRGFTLIEMLVVLAILAALSLVAVRSMTGLQDQGHFEQSQRVLSEVEGAIIGATSRWSEQAYAPGFLSDIGRLPNAGTDPDRQLIELWQQPPGIQKNQLVQDQVDRDVWLAIGWRGPYLQLPLGGDSVRDGYGNVLKVQRDDTTNQRLWGVLAPGADAEPGGQGYAADLSMVLLDDAHGVDRVEARVAGTITVLTEMNPSWRLRVYAYVPDPNTGALLQPLPFADADPATAGPGPPHVFHYVFPQTTPFTPGLRALRAYVFTPAAGQDLRASAHKKSIVATRVLIPGAQTIDLEVP